MSCSDPRKQLAAWFELFRVFLAEWGCGSFYIYKTRFAKQWMGKGLVVIDLTVDFLRTVHVVKKATGGK